MDTDPWFEQYLYDTSGPTGWDDERDYAEEDYWRNRCPACDSKHERDEACAQWERDLID